MVRLNEVGTRVQCPCGDWVDVPIHIGPARPGEGTYVVVPVSFDEDRFEADFEAHLLAAPERAGHEAFVVPVVSPGEQP